MDVGVSDDTAPPSVIVLGVVKGARAVGSAAAEVGDGAVAEPESTVAGGVVPGPAAVLPSAFCFLRAAACLFGGPRRFLGRSKVQGISRAIHDWHGGPPSSHCDIQVRSLVNFQREGRSYLDFADVACIACFL